MSALVFYSSDVMNKFFKISIALNLALASFVWWRLRSRPVAENPSPVSADNAFVSLSASNAASPVAEPIAPKFHWSELESADYRVYIANLRRVECPESTIHDIITADVDEAIFAPRR